jgi:hypothetical protein
MGLIRRKVPRHFVQIHPDNVATNDWVILLEAGTIVGRPTEKLRVAAATLEKKIVTRRNIFLRKTHYLVLPEYDPRIHAFYFCPQLYKLDSTNKLIPLEGEEIEHCSPARCATGSWKSAPGTSRWNRSPRSPWSPVSIRQTSTVWSSRTRL